ncbi:MAG TPA: beta-ketoacyl synthase N-terminal-like domain-containing protein, partial [Chitinophaga sp.]|uniref:type I polyketide synthase n=1 Tax=Chitinophaga sp. TaxID=1869181 RepID=UPI002C290E1D
MNKSHAAEIKQLLLNVKAGKLTADEAKVLLHQYREPVSGGALEDSNTPAAEGSTYKHALQLLITALEEEINIPPAKIRADLPMEKYGLDSVMAINLIRRLEIKLGELPKTLFYEYQTLQEVAEYLATHAAALLDVPAPEKQEQVAVTAPLTPGLPATELFADHDIAIIGVAGRYPMAADLSEFWQQLKAGKDCISEIPAERWPADKYFNPDKHADGSTYSKWGGFLRDIDKFDPLFFNITPKEAAQMDPQERLFLQTIWHTLEDAGYTKKQLWGKAVGVYVGLMYSQYQLLGAEENSKGNMVTPGFSYASVANRVSYFFNFKGPSMAVDSMCSSSLTTIHLACESIRSGESEMALAGGVNLNLHPAKYLYLSQGKFASSEGKCRTFGAGGDGYVPGEGVGAVLLKSRAAAERDGDHIYAVIKGNAINHGGKTNGYTVPNPVAQTEVISRAWLHAGVPLQALNYIEAHGTGTSLGDPIEMAGLVQALAGSGIKAQSCATGAVKSNIGHLESAAGIASVTKVLLQLKYRQLVPSIHSARLNPHIRFEETPFYVQRTLTSWDQVSIQEGGTAVLYPLTAGISSFGAGGANSHLVLQEHITTLQVAYTDPVLIVLSARTTAALEQYARDTIAWLQREEDELLRALPGFLYNLAYTLQTGREAFANRLAVKTHSVSQLLQQLQAFLSAAPATDVWFHHASDDDTPVQTPVVKEMATFAAAWVKGAVIDWRQLYAGTSPAPRRISGPLYPFAKDRYWIEQVKDNRQNTHVALHPLLHRNISILGTQQFESTFDTSLFYLNDHRFRAVPLMPGAAWVEAARAASELSVHAGEAVQLKDV